MDGKSEICIYRPAVWQIHCIKLKLHFFKPSNKEKIFTYLIYRMTEQQDCLLRDDLRNSPSSGYSISGWDVVLQCKAESTRKEAQISLCASNANDFRIATTTNDLRVYGYVTISIKGGGWGDPLLLCPPNSENGVGENWWPVREGQKGRFRAGGPLGASPLSRPMVVLRTTTQNVGV